VTIAVRPLVRGPDDELRVAIYNRAHVEDDDFVPINIDEIRRWYGYPRERFRRRFVAEFNGAPAGIVTAESDPSREEGKALIMGPHVVPELRRRGVGAALMNAALDDVAAHGRTLAEVQEQDRPAANAFLAALGFRLVRRFSEMLRGLAELPRGVGESTAARVVLVDPAGDALKAVVAIENEAFKEHFNHRPTTLEEVEYLVRDTAADGSAQFLTLAYDGDKAVGYLWYGYSPKENAHLNRLRGGFWDIAVLKPWRGRGIAKAMLIDGMERLRAAGMTDAWLYVDDANVTGARHLYERLGFAANRADVVHELDISARQPTGGERRKP
jgi:mycothiol synthase